MKYLVLILGLVACSPPTPAQEVTALKYELKITKGKCAVYTLDPKYPRDVEVTEHCMKLLLP
jgi:hypothetical protein